MQKTCNSRQYCHFHWSVKGKLNLLAKTEIKNVQNTVSVHANKFCFLRNYRTIVHDNNYLFFEQKQKVYINFQELDRLYGENARNKIIKCPWRTMNFIYT